MTRFYWMPLNLDEFFDETCLLSADERGALIYIMAAVFRSSDGWIADNNKELARFTNTNERWRQVKRRISPFLVLADGRLTHEPTKKAKEKASEISRRRKASAESRWRKNNGLDRASGYAKGHAIGDTDTDTDTG